MRTSDSLAALAARWPKSLEAITSTFCDRASFGTTYDTCHNDAGYLLAGLDRFEMRWRQVHPQHYVPTWILDSAAAAEIYYHSAKCHTFRRPVAALSTCICNLVTERPEKILARSRRLETANASKNVDRAAAAESDRRRHAVSPSDMSVLQGSIRAEIETRADRRA